MIEGLLQLKPTLIRGNASEIMAVAGVAGASSKGVDSTAQSEEALEAGKRLAKDVGCVVAISGATDLVGVSLSGVQVPAFALRGTSALTAGLVAVPLRRQCTDGSCKCSLALARQTSAPAASWHSTSMSISPAATAADHRRQQGGPGTERSG